MHITTRPLPSEHANQATQQLTQLAKHTKGRKDADSLHRPLTLLLKPLPYFRGRRLYG